MRIKYTLPGMQPGKTDFEPIQSGSGQTFRSRVRRLTQAVPTSWKQLLRLDQPNTNAATIGPPPRPLALEVKDAASERLRWRNLISRDYPVSGSEIDVGRMLGLLRAYQKMEDSVVARHLSEARV